MRDLLQLEPIFESMYNRRSKVAMLSNSQDSLSESLSFEDHSLPMVVGNVQEVIRGWYGKNGINNTPIGGHPDFNYLEKQDNNSELHHVTTLFLDIKNSTRLGLLYDLEDVFHIKNTILQFTAEIVRAFDGVVHRFMGDALLAYFGRKTIKAEDTCMSALSCAVIVQKVMQQVIVPFLERKQIDVSHLGIRIGVDFGNDNEVLWKAYGYTGVYEVTATSIYVDRASKLQSMAKKNTILIGNNLKEFLDLPEIVLEALRDNEDKIVPYLKPNLTDRNGTQCNYKIYQIKTDNFLDLLPIPIEGKNRNYIFNQNVSWSASVNDQKYSSLGKSLDKGGNIKFEINVGLDIFATEYQPLKLTLIKQNYGLEASQDDCGLEEEKEIFKITYTENTRTLFQRGLSYRGIHTLRAELRNRKDQLLFSDIIGVHIS